MNNISVVTEFLLLGFAGTWRHQLLQAIIFIVIYLAALIGNILIITITTLDPCLHKPMYFFLRHLSLSDLCLVSTVVPKTVVNSLIQNISISFPGCFTQVFLVVYSAIVQVFLLTAMSIDCYAAICHPLYCEVIMNKDVCMWMAAVTWLSGGFMSLIHTADTWSLSYCGLNEIHHFFCDIPQLLGISCSEHVTTEIVLILISAVLGFCCFTCIVISYTYIFYAISKISSMQGQSKAFSTCLPYLVIVALSLLLTSTTYLKPILDSESFSDLILSAFYIMFPPSTNPIIYSLRNKVMKTSLEMFITRKLLRKLNILIFAKNKGVHLLSFKNRINISWSLASL